MIPEKSLSLIYANDSNNNPNVTAVDGKLNSLIYLIIYHLLTDPGNDLTATHIGFGLLSRIGQTINDETLSDIQDSLNDYFSAQRDFLEYNIIFEVKKDTEDPNRVNINCTVKGIDIPTASFPELITIFSGKVYVNYPGLASDEIYQLNNTQSIEDTNPYLARVLRARHI